MSKIRRVPRLNLVPGKLYRISDTRRFRLPNQGPIWEDVFGPDWPTGTVVMYLDSKDTWSKMGAPTVKNRFLLPDGTIGFLVTVEPGVQNCWMEPA